MDEMTQPRFPQHPNCRCVHTVLPPEQHDMHVKEYYAFRMAHTVILIISSRVLRGAGPHG